MGWVAIWVGVVGNVGEVRVVGLTVAEPGWVG